MSAFSEVDRALMARALELAARGLYTTTPNPRVGCVVARDGVVLGEGFHERAGAAHAEVNALADVVRRGHDARGATLVVTLEPCNRHGRTPPCVDAVLAAGIARVVVAMADPNPGAGERSGAAAGGGRRRRCRPRRGGGARPQSRLRLRDDARASLGAHQDRGQPRRTHGAGQWPEPVDHRARRARRRPCVARPRVRHPHRRGHGAAGRSAAQRACGRDAAAAASRDRRPPRADAGVGAGARRRRAGGHGGRAQQRMGDRRSRRSRCRTATAASTSTRCCASSRAATFSNCTSRPAPSSTARCSRRA